jgi:peptide/nickel transport system ATP-binding protein/oligopeptide transport system ATP-binding protein
MSALSPDMTVDGRRDAPALAPLLAVERLTTRFPTERGWLTAVDGVSFTVAPGEVFGLVGESGSGKTATIRSLIGLIPKPGKVVAGAVRYRGRDLLALDERALRAIRGREIAMIFQDPATALNPILRIETQLVEMLRAHGVAKAGAAREQAVELLRAVGIAAPEHRLRDYPHQFSGGMAQRVVIAIAIAANPRLLLADEPTTALDVTIQDQILSLLVRLQREREMSMILVTHNLGVVAETCDRVGVMYAGQLVEVAPTAALLRQPRHPYTLGLLCCVPRVESRSEEIRAIPGTIADLVRPPSGCRFHPRCAFATDECRRGPIPLLPVGPNRWSARIHHARLQSEDLASPSSGRSPAGPGEDGA